MKKFWIFLVSALMVAVSLFSVIGCDSGDKVLSNYLLKESGTLVSEDFVLPSQISEKDVTWSSNNEAITVEKRTEDWLAKVTIGAEATPVTLTVACGNEKKSFEVTVAALDVSYFVSAFNFEYDQATVYEDFELPTTTDAINGKTADITWSVDEGEKYISIAKEGGKTLCKVNQSTVDREVKIYAQFSYNGKTQTPNYRMTVSFERAHTATEKEAVDYWYYNTGVSVTMSGYIVAIATAYSSQYNNVNLYMVDDDYCAGYYLYRVVLKNKTDADLLKPGAHITVTNTTNTNYSGLIETNAGGSLVVDKDKGITETELNSHIYALDNDILANSREAVYHTSTLVSLTNWKVTEKAKSKPTDSGSMFTLEKGGAKVTVAVSKYLEGVYKKDSDTFNAIAKWYDDIKVNDIVNVQGILSNYNGYQILPLKAADVVKAGEESAVPEACTKVKAAIDEVQNAFKTAGLTTTTVDSKTGNCKAVAGYTVVKSNSEGITVPSYDGVEITAKLLHNSDTVEITGNKIKVTVSEGVEDKASIMVTYTVKGEGDAVLYTTSTYHTLYVKDMTDDQVVTNIRFNYELPATQTAVDSVTLDTTYAQFPGATISWEITTPADGVSLNGSTIVVTPSTTAERNIVLTATFSYGNATPKTKTYDFKILKIDPVETGTFKLALDQNNASVNKKLYFTGEMSGTYGATSEDYFDAADVVVAEATINEVKGYTLAVGNKYIEVDTSNKFTLTETATKVWGYDYTLKTFVWSNNDKYYYMGTYSTNTTIGVSETKYISGANAANVGVSQFVAYFEKPTKKSDTECVDAALAKVDEMLAVVSEAGDMVLPASKVSGVTFTYTLAEGTTAATLADGKLSVATLPASNTVVTLTLTAKCGEVTKTKTVKVVIAAPTTTSAILSFADKAQRTSLDNNSQVWAQNSVTFTNAKASSTSNVADYANPVRCYKSSSIKVEFTGMTQIVFACNNASYATELVNSIGAQEGIIVVKDGKNVTVIFTAAKNEFTIAALAAQVQIDSITVKA